jgi:hypothetical protein
MAIAAERQTQLAAHQLVATYVETAALIITLGVTIYAILLSRRTLVADQRAWIAAELQVFTGEVTGGREGMPPMLDLHVGALIKNIGKTPAHGIHTMMEVVLGFGEIEESLARLCRGNLRRDPSNSRMLAPDDQYVREWYLSEAIEPHHVGVNGDRVMATVIGCITYEVRYDSRLHQTAFAYWIGTDVGGMPVVIGPVTDEILLTVRSGGFAN